MTRKDYNTCDSGCGKWTHLRKMVMNTMSLRYGYLLDELLASHEGLPMRGVAYIIFAVR